MKYRIATLVSVFFLFSQAANAGIGHLSVERSGGQFVAEAEFVIAADRDVVVRTFTSFNDLQKINPAIRSSSAQPAADGKLQVTTNMHDCVAMFCRSLVIVELVDVGEDGTITASVLPGAGDFSAGQSTWRFEETETGTRVTYRSEMRPDFWMPPLLGKRAMQRALKRQIKASIRNLEQRPRDATYLLSSTSS